jgi:hypothetical protein
MFRGEDQVWMLAVGVFFVGFGIAIERATRAQPPLRPTQPVSSYWQIASSLMTMFYWGLSLWSLFAFDWWKAALIFVGTAIVSIPLIKPTLRLGAAPGISILSLLIGLFLCVAAILYS